MKKFITVERIFIGAIAALILSVCMIGCGGNMGTTSSKINGVVASEIVKVCDKNEGLRYMVFSSAGMTEKFAVTCNDGATFRYKYEYAGRYTNEVPWHLEK